MTQIIKPKEVEERIKQSMLEEKGIYGDAEVDFEYNEDTKQIAIRSTFKRKDGLKSGMYAGMIFGSNDSSMDFFVGLATNIHSRWFEVNGQ